MSTLIGSLTLVVLVLAALALLHHATALVICGLLERWHARVVARRSKGGPAMTARKRWAWLLPIVGVGLVASISPAWGQTVTVEIASGNRYEIAGSIPPVSALTTPRRIMTPCSGGPRRPLRLPSTTPSAARSVQVSRSGRSVGLYRGQSTRHRSAQPSRGPARSWNRIDRPRPRLPGTRSCSSSCSLECRRRAKCIARRFVGGSKACAHPSRRLRAPRDPS
jgi:hypothetical protein